MSRNNWEGAQPWPWPEQHPIIAGQFDFISPGLHFGPPVIESQIVQPPPYWGPAPLEALYFPHIMMMVPPCAQRVPENPIYFPPQGVPNPHVNTMLYMDPNNMPPSGLEPYNIPTVILPSGSMGYMPPTTIVHPTGESFEPPTMWAHETEQQTDNVEACMKEKPPLTPHECEGSPEITKHNSDEKATVYPTMEIPTDVIYTPNGVIKVDEVLGNPPNLEEFDPPKFIGNFMIPFCNKTPNSKAKESTSVRYEDIQEMTDLMVNKDEGNFNAEQVPNIEVMALPLTPQEYVCSPRVTEHNSGEEEAPYTEIEESPFILQGCVNFAEITEDSIDEEGPASPAMAMESSVIFQTISGLIKSPSMFSETEMLQEKQSDAPVQTQGMRKREEFFDEDHIFDEEATVEPSCTRHRADSTVEPLKYEAIMASEGNISYSEEIL